MRARIGLGNGGLGVDVESQVIVHIAVGIKHSAVAVVGVFVDAQIGHQHDPVAEFGAQRTQRNLHDALRIEGS